MRLLTALSLSLLLCAPVQAAIVVVQAVVGAALTNAPSNGDIVIIATGSPTGCSGASARDSNSVNLAQLILGTNSTANAYIWAYYVTGTPTKTYTLVSCASAQTSIWEISGATLTGVTTSTGTYTTTTAAMGPSFSLAIGGFSVVSVAGLGSQPGTTPCGVSSYVGTNIGGQGWQCYTPTVFGGNGGTGLTLVSSDSGAIIGVNIPPVSFGGQVISDSFWSNIVLAPGQL